MFQEVLNVFDYCFFFHFLDEFFQKNELIVDIKNISNDLYPFLEISICIDFTKFDIQSRNLENISMDNNYTRKFYKFNYFGWLEHLKNIAKRHSHVYYVTNSSEVYHVELSMSNIQNICECSRNLLLTAKTFMHFKMVQVAPGKENEAVLLKFVENSFKHQLTEIGKRSLKKLKIDIFSRFLKWKDPNTNLIAPIVSLCQSSGTGKSKISIELLKINMGFYIVFRNEGQTGFPFMNSISTRLLNLLTGFKDSIVPQNNTIWDQSSIGTILMFFASIITSYFVKIVNDSWKLDPKNLIDSLKDSIQNFGKLFESNENVEKNFKILSDSYVLNRMQRVFQKNSFTVMDISIFILHVLDNPSICFVELDDNIDGPYSNPCKILKEMLNEFPFLFILDEVDLLAPISIKIKYSDDTDSGRTMSGVEALRRALSYLNTASSIFFLTLGTKSSILDLNPPVVDISTRYLERKNICFPIIFSSNCNIFSKEYPISGLTPSFNLLTNPIYFKFLTTLGRGLWGSYPFFAAISAAESKLTNGSNKDLNYFLPSWMILTNFAANPLSSETSSLVAKHMATLLDLSEDLNNIIATYASEPVLAIAAMRLLSSKNFTDKSHFPSEYLFKTLQSKFEGTVIDRGEMSESFAAILILRALAKTPSCAKKSNSDSYECLLKEIKTLTDEKYHQLWETRSNLLDVEECSKIPADERFFTFPNYPVYSVRDFLEVWTGLKNEEFSLKNFNVSEDVLDGIVNATHFVRLNRDSKGFSGPYNQFSLTPHIQPSADSRIQDKSRNVIDNALLSYGLLRTCGFFLPSGSYGIDLVLPVCMKNGGLTMIAIQVKSSHANFSEDINKMQARFNYLKCSTCPKFSTLSCGKCESNENLQKIFFNQISLLVSFNENEKSFRNETRFFKGCETEDRPEILSALTGIPDSKFSLRQTNKNFFKPLVRQNIVLTNDQVLSVGFWADEGCKMNAHNENDLFNGLEMTPAAVSASISQISQTLFNLESSLSSSISQFSLNTAPPNKISQEISKNIPKDGMYHRQFTIFSSGWNKFERLFDNGMICASLAKRILSSEGIFRSREAVVDHRILRTVVHDISPTYFEYSDDLLAMRSDSANNLDMIDEFFGIIQSNEVKRQEKHVKY